MITFKGLELQKFEKNNQYKLYLKVLNKFVESKSKEKNVTHIFVGGSFVCGQLHKFSDLDCYVIEPRTKEVMEKHTKLLGIKLDYLLLDKKIILQEIEKEKAGNFRLFSLAIAKCIKVYGDDSLDKVINFAKKVFESKIPKLSMGTINNNIDFLENQKRETEVLYKTDDTIGFHLRVNHVIHCCVDYYFKINLLLRPAWKNISSEIKDKKFLSLLKRVLIETDDTIKHKKLKKLIDYTVNMLSA